MSSIGPSVEGLVSSSLHYLRNDACLEEVNHWVRSAFVSFVVSVHFLSLAASQLPQDTQPPSLMSYLPVCTASPQNQNHEAGQPCTGNRSQINFPPLQCPQDVTKSGQVRLHAPTMLLESRLIDIRLSCSIIPGLHHLHIFSWSKVVNTFETWPERACSRSHNSYSHWPKVTHTGSVSCWQKNKANPHGGKLPSSQTSTNSYKLTTRKRSFLC